MEWNSKLVQFKDPVYDYIGVPKIYVDLLVDTEFMQRLKLVSQSGIRSIFSSATHDRFSHSLGVYYFSMKIYDSFSANVYDEIDRIALDNKEKELLKSDVKRWENLLSIAALLHDIGHPAFSHAFEFLYDDPFFDFSLSECFIESKEQFNNMLEKNSKLYLDNITNYSEERNYMSPFATELSKHNLVDGKPHERMSAYLILNNDEINDAVKALIIAYDSQIHSGCKSNEDVSDDILFICKMITGQKYNSEETDNQYRLSLKNCFISLLNGIIDADNLDYLKRNSYIAGYNTHNLDLIRLCTAFTVVVKNNQFYSCFEKK